MIIPYHRRRTNCTILFVPANKLKFVMQKLVKAHDLFYKLQQRTNPELRDRYEFLMALVSTIIAELQVPIAIFNAPMSVDTEQAASSALSGHSTL